MSHDVRISGAEAKPKSDRGFEDLRDEVRAIWAWLSEVAVSQQRQAMLADLEPAVQRFELDVFRLVVMGEIKKGKSSFINALLGERDLLPTSTDVATSTVYKLIYGPERKYKVFFLPDVDTGKRPPQIEIDRSELDRYGTEDGNPRNGRRVDFIGVELPNPFLKEGLVLVDTPGVGGLFKSHRDISWRYAPNADAVFFVLDSVESVISHDEAQFLRELTAKVTKRVFFIQTKIDLADTEQWQTWMDRNKEILLEALPISPEHLYYFPVSSLLKEEADRRHDGRFLNDSGFLTLSDFLRRGLMATKSRQLVHDVGKRLDIGCQRLADDIRGQLRICQEQSREKLDSVQREYANARKEWDCWEKATYQPQVQRFADGFADLRQRFQARFQDELDPGGPLIAGAIENLRTSQWNLGQVEELVQRVQHDWLASAAEQAGCIQREFNNQVSGLLSECCDAMIGGFAIVNSAADTADEARLPAGAVEKLPVRFSGFEEARNTLYGGMAGAAMGQIGIVVASFLLPPVAVVAGIAAIAGAIIGATLASQDLEVRRREEVIMKLQAILQNLARRCQRQAINRFNEMTSSYERRARESFAQAAQQARDTLQRRMQEVEATKNRSRAENETAVQNLHEAVTRIDGIRESLRRVVASPSGQQPPGR